MMGHAAAQLVEALRYKPEGRGFDSQWCHWNWSLTESFRPHYGPSVDSASNRNEYQEYFLGEGGGLKAAGAQGWQPYHLHVPIVLKSGSLKLPEPSEPVQTYNGIALTYCVCTCWLFRIMSKFCSPLRNSHCVGKIAIFQLVVEVVTRRHSSKVCSHDTFFTAIIKLGSSLTQF